MKVIAIPNLQCPTCLGTLVWLVTEGSKVKITHPIPWRPYHEKKCENEGKITEVPITTFYKEI